MEKAKVSRVPETTTVVDIKGSSSLVMTFTIPNFSGLKNRTERIVSPEIKIRRSTCCIQVQPKHTQKGYSKAVEIYVMHTVLKRQNSKEVINAVADIKISILNCGVDSGDGVINSDDEGFDHFLEHDDIFGDSAEYPLEDDTLVIRVDIKLLYQDTISEELPRHRLRALFDSQATKDFTLISADGKERRAHKNILSVASPVFERMFQSSLAEAQTGSCTISDISTSTLDILLKFIYNCTVPNLAKNAKDLLPAADKYEMLDLKKACEEALMNDIKLNNSADLLLLADMHSAVELKKAVLTFVETKAGIKESAKAIDEMMDKAVKSGRTDLVKELFSAVFKSGKTW